MRRERPADEIPAEIEDKALAEFTEYFVRNYPGPRTIIGDPHWHAPRIYRAAQHALTAAAALRARPDRGEVERRLYELFHIGVDHHRRRRGEAHPAELTAAVADLLTLLYGLEGGE